MRIHRSPQEYIENQGNPQESIKLGDPRYPQESIGICRNSIGIYRNTQKYIGIQRNPQEFHRNPQEFCKNPWEPTRIHRSSMGINRNPMGIHKIHENYPQESSRSPQEYIGIHRNLWESMGAYAMTAYHNNYKRLKRLGAWSARFVIYIYIYVYTSI